MNTQEQVRGKTCECKCARCGALFTARVADRKRGWARFCSKSCKAIKQMQSRPTYPTRPHYISKKEMNATALHDGTEAGRADPDTQGHSDGASNCAQAIRNLKEPV